MSGVAASDPARAAAFVALMQSAPEGGLIANLRTKVELLSLAGLSLPLTRNDREEAGNCYLCRPSAAYIDYALAELRHFTRQPLLYGAVAGLIRAGAPLVRASGLDHQWQINNWLFSTNPVPDLTKAQAGTIRDHLIARDPTRAIVLRSLNPVADGASMAALREAGFQMLPARRIWLYDGAQQTRQSRDMKRDAALLRDARYTLCTDFSAADYERAAQLYAQLYLEKYTPLNPAYRGAFLQKMHEAGLMKLIGLRAADGTLSGVTGLYESGRTLTQPIVGYDTARPEAEGLYRRLMAVSRLEAEAGGRFFNMSAGAAGFKKNREARPVIEYSAIFTAHLGAGARMASGAMVRILTGIGLPLLERFDL